MLCGACLYRFAGINTTMNEQIQKLLAASAMRVEEATTLPPACYHEAGLLDLEAQRLFRSGWVGVGRADRWCEPGDFAALDLAGVPLIVLRDRDGALRCFANTCRHRGARLVTGEGSCRGIKCPFHGWAYKLDGRLAGAPRMEDTAAFDKADYGMIEFRAAERDGFAFICLDSAAPGIDTILGDFSQIHAPWSPGTLRTGRRREFDVGCNWKAFLEVFNEYYHLPYVHPDSLDDTYALPDAADQVTGAYATQFGTTAGTGGLLEDNQSAAFPVIATLEGRNRQGARYTWLFPNMTFAASQEAMWVYEAQPLTPESCRVVQTICFPRQAFELDDYEERSELYFERLDVALNEDIPILLEQQAGIRSPYARPGRFSPLLEANVARFADWYAGRMLPS